MKRTKIITIANQKGGVGKTTTALCLGSMLELKGFSVLYIDLDKQQNLSTVLRADTTKGGSYDILANRTSAKELVQTTSINANIISASKRLGDINELLNSNTNALGKEYRLKKSLEDIKGYFDFVILDTPPTLDNITINALTSTDYLVMVANADKFSLDGIKDLIAIVESVKEYTNPSVKLSGILINNFKARANISNAYKETFIDFAKKLGTKVFNTFIRENIAIVEMQTERTRITNFSAKTNAYKDYLAFTEEFLSEVEL